MHLSGEEGAGAGTGAGATKEGEETTRGCEEKNGFNLGSFVSDGVTAIYLGENLN